MSKEKIPVGTNQCRSVIVTLAAIASFSGTGFRGPAEHRNNPPEIARGRLEQFVIHDSSYGRDRQVWVYTPPGYDAHRTDPYPLIVAFDGDEYRDTMPLPAILDTLFGAGSFSPGSGAGGALLWIHTG
jgi:enterochelin esterase-like enzyme